MSLGTREESDFAKAVERSAGTVVVPLGVVEKHGPHLPLGTDLLDAREVVLRAVKKEYSIVFPPYYFSQIFEAKHQPGTLAYSARLTWDVLQETVDEIARNGVKKIISRPTSSAMIRAVKADESALGLQQRFFDEADKPLQTPQR